MRRNAAGAETALGFAEMGSTPMGKVREVWLGPVALLGTFRTLSICSFEENATGETLSCGLNNNSKYSAFKLPLGMLRVGFSQVTILNILHTCMHERRQL